MPRAPLSNTTLHFTREGRGEPLLLIQGVGAAASGWRPQIDHFSDSFDVVAFDNRGIGESAPGNGDLTIEAMADDTRELMDLLGWPSAHLVGHSMGGLIAQQLAVSHPRRVKSLSLLCTFSRGREATRLTPRILWLGLRTRVGTRRMRRHALLRMILSRRLFATGDRDRLAEDYAALMGRDLADSPPILLRQMRAMSRHDLFSSLGALAGIPTLVVSAEEDPIARSGFGAKLAGAIPHAAFELLPGLSHAAPIEQAEIVNERLRRFLAPRAPEPLPRPA